MLRTACLGLCDWQLPRYILRRSSAVGFRRHRLGCTGPTISLRSESMALCQAEVALLATSAQTRSTMLLTNAATVSDVLVDPLAFVVRSQAIDQSNDMLRNTGRLPRCSRASVQVCRAGPRGPCTAFSLPRVWERRLSESTSRSLRKGDLHSFSWFSGNVVLRIIHGFALSPRNCKRLNGARQAASETSDGGTTHVCVYCTRTSTEHPEHIRHSSHVLSLMHFFLQESGRIFQWT